MPRQRSVSGCYRRQQIRQSKLPNVTAVQRKIRNSFRSSVHVGVEVTVDTFLPLLPSHRCHKDWIALHLRIIHCREANEYAGLGWWYFYFVRMPSEVRSRSPSSPSLPPSNSGALVLPGGFQSYSSCGTDHRVSCSWKSADGYQENKIIAALF